MACYTRPHQIAISLQEKYELLRVNGARPRIEPICSLVHDPQHSDFALAPAAPTKTPVKNSGRPN